MQIFNPDIKPHTVKCSTKRIWLVADLHLDAWTFRADLLKKAKEKIGDDPVIGLGDMTDIGFYDNVYSQLKRQAALGGYKASREEIREELGIAAMKKTDEVLEMFNWIAMVEGNHDERQKKKTGDNYLKHACKKKGIIFEEGQLLLDIVTGKKLNTTDRHLRILAMHGSRGGRRAGAVLNELEDIWSTWFGVDVIAIGHHHQADIRPMTRNVANQREICKEITWLVAVPSFLGWEEYAQKRGYKPPVHGVFRININNIDGIFKPVFEFLG
jgi:predicted phosphodiesterase